MSTIPVPPVPIEDADLDAILQQVVTGITGLPGNLVRPRWQPVPPKQPEPTVNWCAIGVTASTPDAFPYITHVSGSNITDPSADTFWRHEQLEVLVSFYGPQAKNYADYLRDGLNIPQNCEVLVANQMAFVGADVTRAAPDLINQQWVRRFDTTLLFNRKVQRVYAMPNILSANVHLFDDTGHVDDTIPVPPT